MTMTRPDEPLAGVLDRTFDVDAHEMVPAHLWGEVFGEASGRIADLVEPALGRFGGNDFASPGFVGDVLPATHENVWNVRGAKAPGAVDFARRIEVMDAMGTYRQLVFPSYALFACILLTAGEFYVRDVMGVELPEDEARALGRAGLDEYNAWVVRTAAIAPDRLRPVAYLIPDNDVDSMLAEAASLVERGVRAVSLPAGMPPAGCSPAAPELDPFYELLAERDVALTIHIGGEHGFMRSPQWGRAPAFKPGKVQSHEIGLEPHSMSTVHFAVANYLTVLLLGGVFERHPTLRFGAVEIGAHWFGPLADSLDMWARDVHAHRLAPFISMLPSAYMARNVRVTPFNNFEPIDTYFERYPRLRDCYCYSTDYPHIEGGKGINEVFLAKLERLGPEIVERFFVGNGRLLLPD